MNKLQHAKLLNALTTYDEKQSRKKFYNRYALGQYCAALSKVQKHCDRGADLRVALLNCFNGKLLDTLLRAVALEVSTEGEVLGAFKHLRELDD